MILEVLGTHPFQLAVLRLSWTATPMVILLTFPELRGRSVRRQRKTRYSRPRVSGSKEERLFHVYVRHRETQPTDQSCSPLLTPVVCHQLQAITRICAGPLANRIWPRTSDAQIRPKFSNHSIHSLVAQYFATLLVPRYSCVSESGPSRRLFRNVSLSGAPCEHLKFVLAFNINHSPGRCQCASSK